MAGPPPELNAPRIFMPDYYERMRELERASWWNAGMRDVASMLLGLVTLPARGRLLDVGCGSGQTMSWFSSLQPEWRTLGIDVAPEGLAAARACGLRTVLRASALDLPLPTALVDLVISLDMLQHVPLDGGDVRALAEMARVLKPGGHLFLRTNGQSFPRVADDPTFQFHKYDTEELRSKLRDAGFRVVRLGRVNALLGLAEIPRELRVRNGEHSYHGLLSEPRAEPRWLAALKRAWLRLEGRLVRRGASLPLGRTIVALCQR
jgi:SAM-dependent methyltransferase